MNVVNHSFRHVLLDRDGVLNVERSDGGYVLDWSQWCWLPGALDGLRAIRAAGLRISIITNQSAVGRGLMTRSDMDQIHTRMLADAEQAGAGIDAVYACPHAPSAHCECRKPAPGLLRQAINDAGIPANQTVMVGDDLRDLQSAWSAGIAACLVRTGKGARHSVETGATDVPVFDDLPGFAAALIAGDVAVAHPLHDLARRTFADHCAAMQRAAASLPVVIETAGRILSAALESGNKILVCGNGGSAATAQHFVAELVGRFQRERRALAAISLTTDTSILSAVANDYGYTRVFSRQVEALARPGDVLVAISTSGNSPNVIDAARCARASGCKVIAMTGENGGALAGCAHAVLNAPSTSTARVQEIHDVCIHVLADALEGALEWSKTA